MVAGDQPPWSGVVRVQTEIGRRCSGALVGLRLVLTAAHCLFGRGTGKLVRASSVHVLGGGRYGLVRHARATAFVIGRGYALGPDQQRRSTAPADADWAVLTLDAPLGTPAMLGGYEQDRAEVIVADTACFVIGPVRDVGGEVMLRHSCSATRGSSGAPLLVRMPGGGWGVAGVASTAAVGTSGGQAVPVSAIASD
jgi:protease YdgD